MIAPLSFRFRLYQKYTSAGRLPAISRNGGEVSVFLVNTRPF
jgi:hypothetical protein